MPVIRDMMDLHVSPAVRSMFSVSFPKFSARESTISWMASSKLSCRSESISFVSEMYLSYWVSCKSRSASSKDTFKVWIFAFVSSDMSPA